MRKSLTIEQPAVLMATLGGAVGLILFSAILFLLPLAGFPELDVPRAIGGVAVAGKASFWVGYTLLVLLGWLGFPSVLALAWRRLPGSPLGLRGALLKGLIFGAGIWALGGLLLPLFGTLAGPPVENPGLLGFGVGPLGGLGLLIACIAYGVCTAVIAAMGQGVRPLDSLGWEGHGSGRAA